MTVNGNIRAKLRSGLIKVLPLTHFSVSDSVMPQRLSTESRRETAVDVLLANPPVPEGKPWSNSKPPVGRYWPEGMIWSQVSLAQMAAMLAPDYEVADENQNLFRAPGKPQTYRFAW